MMMIMVMTSSQKMWRAVGKTSALEICKDALEIPDPSPYLLPFLLTSVLKATYLMCPLLPPKDHQDSLMGERRQ
jgi:hypothetical protein